ncbi:MAG: putative ABC transport system permease protein, partial [Gammaproteobacteria bacterium]
MRWADSMALSAGALRGNMRRTILIGLATAIGVSSVLLLTSLGQGVRHLVIRQFETLGTNLLIVAPGRSETVGGAPPMLGTTPRDLTLGDALALARHPAVAEVAPVVLGAAPVSVASGLERELTILGSTAALRQVRHLKVGQGKFLPDADPRRPAAVCVLGYGARRALFGNRSAYGRWVRIGDRRFRV